MSDELIHAITIPLFTGAIGYVTNWTGVWMLFYPLSFHGFRLPGLAAIAHHLPRRVQQVPGVMQGGIGWQGIIPSRAAQMRSIAVDKGIAKLGRPAEFYRRLDPEGIAEHILSSAGEEVREVVDRILEREYPRLWRDLPPRIREMVHSRVAAQLPEVVHGLTEELGENVDQMLDIKLMVIRGAPTDRSHSLAGSLPKAATRVAGVYAGIISEELITLEAIGDELLNGRRGDRTRQMIETMMREPVDRAVGRARPAVRAAMGSDRYGALCDSVAEEVVDYTIAPLADPDFNRRQSLAMRELIRERMEQMPARDFSEMLRSAIRQDEWLLLLHGAV